MARIGRYEKLPGSDRSAADVGVDGASVTVKSDGGKHVTLWNGSEDGPERYSYDVDRHGHYVSGSCHYTDNMSYVMAKMGHSRW
jgi:hypothetical protein